MLNFRFLASIVLSLLVLSGCNRDPEVVKRKYLENGNKYFDRGKYKEARIMYRNALQKDLKYGEAHYRLALTYLQLKDLPQATQSLRRAVELLPPKSKERKDARIKLAEIYVAFSELRRLNEVIQEIGDTVDDLLKDDPDSFDGHRLKGMLALLNAKDAAGHGQSEASEKFLDEAIAELRKTNSIKANDPDTVISLARALSGRRNFAEAETLYRSLIAERKNYLPAYMSLYLVEMVQSRPDDAEKVLLQAVQNNPKEYGLLLSLAEHYYRNKKRDEVVNILQKLKQHAKEYPQAYQDAGGFYFRLGDGAEAIRQYEEGIRYDEKNARRYKKLIIEVLLVQNKREEARKLNDEILAEDPKDTDALGLAGSLMLDKGDVANAINQLRTVVVRAPNNFVAQFNLGRALMAKGELETAKKHFNEAINLRQNYLAARLALGQVHITQRNYDDALKLADETLKYDPNSIPARLIRSAANIGLRRPDPARQELTDILQKNPNSPDAYFQLGLLNALEKRYVDAQEAYRKCYELNPANTRGLMGQAEVFMAQNQPDKALGLLKQEIDKYPTRLELRTAYGNLAVRTQKLDLALEQYKWLLDRVDHKSVAAGDIYVRLAETYRRKGDMNLAIAMMQKAREILPQNTVVMNTLALMLDQVGRKPEARSLYEATLRLESENPIVLNNLAFLLASDGGDLDQALTYAQRAKQKLPQVPEVSDTLGWIYLKKNLADQALEIFRDCVAKAPNNPTFRYHLAQALVQKGEMAKARLELKAAMANNPQKDEAEGIRQLLAKIG